MLPDCGLGLKSKGSVRPLAVLFPGALGDAVCFEPALDDLAAAAKPVLYARGAAAGIAGLFPCRPEVRSLDSPEIARLFAPVGPDGFGPGVDELPELRAFARIVSFTGRLDTAAAGRLRAVGAVLAAFPRDPSGEHACDAFLRRATGDPVRVARAPRLFPPPGPMPLVLRSLPSDRPVLAIHPGAGSPAKRVSAELLAALAGRWRREGGLVCAVLGPAEEDLRRQWSALADALVEPADPPGLAAVLSGARAFLGADSGPAHVAAALGIPGVAIFTVTDPAAWGPRGGFVTSVSVADDEVEERAWGALRAALP